MNRGEYPFLLRSRPCCIQSCELGSHTFRRLGSPTFSRTCAPSSLAQLGDDLIFRSPSKLEQQKWIRIELLAQQIIDRRDMLAGIRIIRTRTLSSKIGSTCRKQCNPSRIEGLLDVLRHLARKQLGRKHRLG